MPSSSAGRRPALARRRPQAIKGEMVLDEATARRLRRLRWRRLALFLSPILVIAAFFALYLSPAFRVHDVEVVGAEHVNAEQVAQLASLDGHSMFRLDLQEAEQRITFLPLIKSAHIERQWPQGARIVVTERAPWAYWQVGSTNYVIDGEGIVLADLPPPEGAPVIRDLSNPVRLVPGDHVDADAVALTRALLDEVPQTLAIKVSTFEYSTDKGLTLVTDAGYRVVIGDSQNTDYKLAVWKAIEGELGRDKMAGHVLDLRFEERPSFQ